MDSENPDSFARRNRDFIPVYDADRPFPPSWFSSRQAFHVLGSIPTMNSSFPSFYHSRWGDQTWSGPPQYDYLQDIWRLSNYPMASSVTGLNCENGVSSNAAAALASFESAQRLSGGENPDSMQPSNENLQLQSSIIPKANLEGVPSSVASESMVSPEGGHEAKNDAQNLRQEGLMVSSMRQDSPSIEMQLCNKKLENGEDAQKVTSVENSDAVHRNRSSESPNPTELNQNLEKGPIESGTNPEPAEEQEDEETRKARKRQANRESCRRTRMKKKKQYEELDKTVDSFRDKNAELRKRLLCLSKECSQLTKENDSILEELVEKYGEEAVADLSKQSLPETESTAGDETQS